MTCREKLAIEHPEDVIEICGGGCVGCPGGYGYADKPKWCEVNKETCTKCWDREVEETAENVNGVEVVGGFVNERAMDKSVIKNSGDRTVFSTGAVRSMHEGEGRCDLLPACVLLRLARHYENGAREYGVRNWQGIPCHSFADSALRHLLKYLDGQTDEDHLIAAIWNLCGLAWTEEKMPELMDIPERQKSADT